MATDTKESLEELIENEWYIVRHSGETPEIAYNSSIYFLERAKDGPGIVLTKTQRELLQKAAIDRYEEIVLRDMYHDNVGKSIYRGVARSICNYERFIKYCTRQNLESASVRDSVAHMYSTFLQREFFQISSGSQQSVINCSYDLLRQFATILDVEFLPEYILFEDHCQQSVE